MTVDVYLETDKIEFSNKAKENKVRGAMSILRIVQRAFYQAGAFPCIVHTNKLSFNNAARGRPIQSSPVTQAGQL